MKTTSQVINIVDVDRFDAIEGYKSHLFPIFSLYFLKLYFIEYDNKGRKMCMNKQCKIVMAPITHITFNKANICNTNNHKIFLTLHFLKARLFYN